MKIKLLKEWVNGEDKYTPNDHQILEIPDEAAKQLIEDGIAEKHNPATNPVVVVREVENEVEKLVKAKIEQETQNAQTKKIDYEAADKLEKSGGYDEFWQFASDVFKAGPGGQNTSKKLDTWEKSAKTAGYMTENDQAQGGYLVPTEFRAQLFENLIEAAIIRSRATQIPMNSSSIKVPSVTDNDHSSNLYGGIVLYRPAEGGQKTPSNPKFAQVQLTLHKLVGLVYTSDELLQDSAISLQPLLSSLFSKAFAWQEDEDFINGTGANMPMGVMNAPCMISVAKEAGQAANTIETQNILKMWARLRPSGQGNAIWLANSDTFPQLATLKMEVGTGGSSVGLLNVNNSGIVGAPAMTLLGRPLMLTEHARTVGDSGDIILGDWRQYLIGQRAGASSIAAESSIHLRFDYDETAFRFVMRYDGQPWEASATTPKYSSDTISSFVKLDAR